MRSASLTLLLTAPLACALVLAGCGSDAGPGGGVGPDGGLPDGAGGDGRGGDAPPAIDAGIDAPQPQSLAVCATGAADFPTIAAAIAAANPGSTLTLCPGTYPEQLVIDGKPLVIVGAGGAAATFLDGSDLGVPLTIRATGGAGVSVRGLTIQHGRSATEGGGVRCEGSTLSITDSELVDNVAVGGGGLFASACALEIERTTFARNQGGPRGGGALVLGSTGTVTASTIADNQAAEGGGIHSGDLDVGGVITAGDVALVDNTIRANRGHRGGGLYHASSARLAGNVIADNTVDWVAGGAFVFMHAPIITGNTIRGNQSVNDGGGIYLHVSSATLEGNHVHDNVSGDDGGGIRVFESAAMLIANTVENNRAGDGGGGIRVSHVPSVLLDNIVRNNTATGTGGGLDLDNDSSLVRGGEISGNRASGSGGGIFIWLGPWDGHRLEDLTIRDNRAWQGGGIYVVDNFEPVTMKRLRVTGNRAGKGGGLMISSTTFTLTHSIFAGNTASDRGGAIFAGASPTWEGLDGSGTGMCPCPPAAPVGTTAFNVIAGNQAPRGAGVWSAFPALSIDSSILVGHTGAAIEASDESPPPAAPEDPPVPPPLPSISYSDVYPAVFAGMTDPTGQDGNLSVDPMFVDAAAGDYHLLPGSPCIDAAAPSLVDADGTRADMGMFGGAP